MFTKRILSTIVLCAFVLVGVTVDWLCGILVIGFIVVGLYEYFLMLEHKGIRIYKYFGIAMGALIPISLVVRFELTKGWELLFIVLGLLFLILMQFRRRQSSGVIVDISTTIFGIMYVSWFFSFLIRIRYLPNGLGLLVCVVLITKLGDIGAYLVGSRFGKHPLIPRISPKKSVEGAVGGFLCSILGALVCKPFLGFSWPHLVAIGAVFGILGQLGDLSESLMKRDCQVKDSGNIVPGMGGVLDTIDSLLFTGPVFYFYMSFILRNTL